MQMARTVQARRRQMKACVLPVVLVYCMAKYSNDRGVMQCSTTEAVLRETHVPENEEVGHGGLVITVVEAR